LLSHSENHKVSAMSSPGAASTSDWEPPLPDELQRMLPNYEVTGILGRGGMGAVYKGIQRNLERPVAIKLLPETFSKGADELNFTARFKQEARAMAKMAHPAIISVYDFGETENGQLYFVMEFIDGMDIHQYMKAHGGKLPQEHALNIVAHVLDALEYAHHMGIVHRDIKPANILINREGRVKIADFGLAKKFGAASDQSQPALTMSNVAVGTPDFVAPESLEAGRTVDHRADLYAVGVMLYQLLTGRLPRGQFKSPSEAVPGLDPRLDAIVSRAMQTEPEDRYPSASAVRADLDVIFSRPMARVEAGAETEDIPVAVPVTTTVKEGAIAAKAGAGSAKRTPSPGATKPRAGSVADRKAAEKAEAREKPKGPLILGVSAAAAVVLGLAVYWLNRGPSSEPVASAGKASPPTASASDPAKSGAVAPAENLSRMPEPRGENGEMQTKLPPKVISTAPETPHTPEKPPSAETVAFSPGKWVKVYSKGDDLPKELRQSDSGVRFDDGWIRFTPGQPKRIPIFNGIINGAVRARVQRLSDKPQNRSTFVLRSDGTESSHYYRLYYGNQLLVASKRVQEDSTYVFQAPVNDLPTGVGEYTMEFAAVGSHLIGRFGSQTVRVARGADLSGGIGYITGEESLRDIEVINLDGLPEAEALRLIGVDAEGKDLRQPQPVSITSTGTQSPPPLPSPEPIRTKYPLTIPPRPSRLGEIVVWRMDGKPLSEEDRRLLPPNSPQDVVQITASNERDTIVAAALRTDGTVLTFADGSGQPTGLNGIVAVHAAARRFLATTEDGELKSWGPWTDSGSFQNRRSQSGRKITQLVTGPGYDLLLLDDGSVLTRESSPWGGALASYGPFCALANGGGRIVAITGEGRLLELSLTEKTGAPFPFLRKAADRYTVGQQAILALSGETLVGAYPETSASDHTSVLEIVGQSSRCMAMRLKAGGWRFTTSTSLEVNTGYCEEQSRDCFALAIAGSYVFGLRPPTAERITVMEQVKTADALAAVPELNALHEQFLGLEAERVTKVFTADLATLNTGYLGGIDRAIADAKKAGSLDTVLALEQEKARIAANEGVPTEDEATAPESLKKLRVIYRDSLAKLEAARAANRKTLTDPLIVRLKQMEIDLTKQDRIAHAKTVREYREKLEAPAETKPVSAPAPATGQTPGKAATPQVETVSDRVRPDPKRSRAAAEYALGVGANVTILVKGATTQISSGGKLPNDDFELHQVSFPGSKGLTITDADLAAITEARELRRFSTGDQNKPEITTLAPFKKTPLIEEINCYHFGILTESECATLASLPNLKHLNVLGRGDPVENLALLLSAPALESISFSGGRLRPEDGEVLNRFPKLRHLRINAPDMDPILAKMGKMDRIEILGMSHTTVSEAGLGALNGKLADTLMELLFGKPADDSSAIASFAFRRFPKLKIVDFRGEISAEAFAGLRNLPSVSNVTFNNTNLSPAHFDTLSQCRTLSDITIGAGSITSADLAMLRRLTLLKKLLIRDNGIRIDPAAIPEFAKLDTLTKIELPESQVTEAQITELKKALPKCAISRVSAYQ
jgi:serine/threonine protein kinase